MPIDFNNKWLKGIYDKKTGDIFEVNIHVEEIESRESINIIMAYMEEFHINS